MTELTPKEQYAEAYHLRRLMKAWDGTSATLFRMAQENEGNYFVHESLMNVARQAARMENETWHAFYMQHMPFLVSAISDAQMPGSDRYETGNWLRERNPRAWDRWLSRQQEQAKKELDDIPF